MKKPVALNLPLVLATAALSLCTGVAQAAADANSPAAYAIRVPVTLAADAPLQRVVLPAEVLVRLQSPGYADVRLMLREEHPEGVKCPPSLRNMFQELTRDLGGALPASGSLQGWAQQGVLLLNTCLTVEQGAPASHAKQGWETLTDALIAACSAHESPKVFLLWGAHAQSKLGLIDASRHLVLQANHPSPLSARRPPRPFIG